MEATLSATQTEAVPGLALALERVQALSLVLEDEFAALKVQDLDPLNSCWIRRRACFKS